MDISEPSFLFKLNLWLIPLHQRLQGCAFMVHSLCGVAAEHVPLIYQVLNQIPVQINHLAKLVPGAPCGIVSLTMGQKVERVLPSSISQAWWHHHSVRFIIAIWRWLSWTQTNTKRGGFTQKAVSHAETGPGPQYAFSLTPHTAPSLFLWGLYNSQTTWREKRRINWKDVKNVIIK